MLSTRADNPTMSLRRMNSCRKSVQVWPVRVRKLMAVLSVAKGICIGLRHA